MNCLTASVVKSGFSVDSPTTSRPCDRNCLYSLTSSGVSKRQGPHHVAHRFTSNTFPAYLESFIGAPLTDRSSTSTTFAGNVITRAGAAGAGLTAGGAVLRDGVELSRATLAACGSGRVSSLEVQLETPKTATNDKTIIVQARRAGVHNASPVSIFLFSCIYF